METGFARRRKAFWSVAGVIAAIALMAVSAFAVEASSAPSRAMAPSPVGIPYVDPFGTTTKVAYVTVTTISCPNKTAWKITFSGALNGKTFKTSKGGKGAGPAVVKVLAGINYTWTAAVNPNDPFTFVPSNGSLFVTGNTTLTLLCQPKTYLVDLNNTLIAPNPVIGGNISAAHPWGEAYDSENSCLYVTEDTPASSTSTGFVTAIGPSFTPLNYPTMGNSPYGIAWGPLKELDVRGLGLSATQLRVFDKEFLGGMLLVANYQSSTISVFAVGATKTGACGITLVQVDGYGNSAGLSLSNPFDIVFDSAVGVFYVTWAASSYVTGLVDSTEICSTNANLTGGEPLGLSYNGLPGKLADINVAVFAANGWDTQIHTIPGAANLCAPDAASAAIFDRAIWTTSAPKIMQNNTSFSPWNVIAVSDSNYGISGNVEGNNFNAGAPNHQQNAGNGCTYAWPGAAGTPPFPVGHVMGELNSTLSCSNAVALDGNLTNGPAAAAPFTDPPYPSNAGFAGGALAVNYSAYTQRAYDVLSAPGNRIFSGPLVGFSTLEAVTWSAVYETVSTRGTLAVDVIWFVPTAGHGRPTCVLGAAACANPYFDMPAKDGTLIVTNWGSGTLMVSPAF